MADEPNTDVDEVAVEMEQRIQTTENLLEAHKIAHAQAIRDAQAEGVEPSAQAMATIMKLERELANMRHLLRLRKLTREP